MRSVSLQALSSCRVHTAANARWIALIVVCLASMFAGLGTQRAAAENLTLSVRADIPAGTLPTWYEPSAFVAFATDGMKREFQTDSVRTRGMFIQTVHYLLAQSTSLSDYKARLVQSRLAEEAKLIAAGGGQVLVAISGMPAWLSSSSVTDFPTGCSEEWPIYQTVAPHPAKWADWQAAIRETVAYFNVTNKLTNVWYEFWPEADTPCFWTDSQDLYLQTWQHFAVGARSADPRARLGGPGTAGGPGAIKRGESVPLMQAFIDYSVAHGIKLDFVSYHLFGSTPEEGRLSNRTVLSMLSAKQLPRLPIMISSWNPLHACYENNFRTDDPSWPSAPSAHGCWQTDTEMGASYSLALMSHLAHGRVAGYQAMYGLDDANVGGTEEFPSEWGMRTNHRKNGIRKALYHAHTIVGRMPRSLVTSTVSRITPTAEYFDHVNAIAGVAGDKMSILFWSYVTSPGRQAVAILRDMGYRTTDFQRWGGLSAIADFVTDRIPVSRLTSVTKEQGDLQRMKDAFRRQTALVKEVNNVSFALSGFPSGAGYRMTRYLIDSTNNNAYATYKSSGLAAAVAGHGLQPLDTRTITSLSEIPAVALKPYAVMLIEIERIR